MKGPIRITIPPGQPPLTITEENGLWHFTWDEDPPRVHPYHVEELRGGTWVTIGRMTRLP